MLPVIVSGLSDEIFEIRLYTLSKLLLLLLHLILGHG